VGQVQLSPIRAAGPTERFEDHVKDIDLVLDMVGSETVDRSWSVLSPNGAVVSVADAAIESKIPAGLRGYFVNAQPDATRLKAIAEQVAKGEFQYKIAQVFPFKELLQAVEVGSRGQHRHAHCGLPACLNTKGKELHLDCLTAGQNPAVINCPLR